MKHAKEISPFFSKGGDKISLIKSKFNQGNPNPFFGASPELKQAVLEQIDFEEVLSVRVPYFRDHKISPEERNARIKYSLAADKQRDFFIELIMKDLIDCRALTALTLINCDFLTMEWLYKILDANPKIEKLNLTGCRSVNLSSWNIGWHAILRQCYTASKAKLLEIPSVELLNDTDVKYRRKYPPSRQGIHDKYIPIIIAGHHSGKTALLIRFHEDRFDESPPITRGIQKYAEIQNETCLFTIFDTSYGYFPHYRDYAHTPMKCCAIICSSIASTDLDELATYINGVRRMNNSVPILIVGTQSDRRSERKYDVDYCHGLAVKSGAIGYLECSAKDDENVDKVFRTAFGLAKKYYDESQLLNQAETKRGLSL